MKKNLKKVISAVLALTLAMSSFVAMTTTSSAATFADVADTANYAEAVNALAALGAIAGYEDGTFLPDNNITRAEVATMVVAALNMSEDAKNSGSTTKFADVNANAAWAAGYVNVGVAQGYISGMSATEFAPSENVTYAQVLSMLTRILGYSDFAIARGGWPDGYLAAASAAGILSGVAAATNDTVTRAQVAQLIWNAVQAPMLDITTFSGNLTDSEMEKMDGKNGKDFKTVLSEKFDAYVVSVEVTDTSKANPNMEIGDVQIKFTGSKDYDPENGKLVGDVTHGQVNSTDSSLTKDEVAAGKTAAEDYLFSSAKAIVEYNDDDEWTLIYFAPTSKVATKTVDGTLVKDGATGTTATELQIKKSKTTSNVTKYKLTPYAAATTTTAEKGAKFYVNGVEYDNADGYINANLATFTNLLKVSEGDTVLYQNSNASGTEYDKVMFDVYALASVNQVKTSGDDVTIRLSTVNYHGVNPGTAIEIDADEVADGNKIVNITKNGAAVDATALAKDDVIAIKYDITKDFATCKTIDIIATDEKVSGQYTSYDSEEGEYVVAGQTYEASRNLSTQLERGASYTFRLDPFGKLFAAGEEVTSKIYAIVESYVIRTAATGTAGTNVSSGSAEYDYINVMTLDGQSKRLYIENTYANTVKSMLNFDNGTLKIHKWATSNTAPMPNRVIAYSVKSNGRINKIELSTLADPTNGTFDVSTFGTNHGGASDEVYNSSSNTLSKRLASNAVVLDATDYTLAQADVDDYKASSLSALAGTVKYSGFLVHQNTAKAYQYVVITKAGSKYGTETDFAVAAVDASVNSAEYVNEEEVYKLRVMNEGVDKADESFLNISLDAVVSDGTNTNVRYDAGGAALIKAGAAFLYSVDSYGFVDEIDVIFKGNYGFNATLAAGFQASNVMLPGAGKIQANDWLIDINDKNFPAAADSEIQLFVAPVILADDSSVTFATLSLGVDHDNDASTAVVDAINTTDDYSYAIASDANIYAYDLSGDETSWGAFSGGSFSGIDLSEVADNGYALFSTLGTTVPSTETDYTEAFQMAFVMVADGMVTNAIVFNN